MTQKTPAEIEIEKAMIELIKNSSGFKESFIFEELQGYMDLSDLNNPKWTSNVRIRMLEDKEAYEEGLKQGIELGRKESEEEIRKLVEQDLLNMTIEENIEQQLSNQKKEIIEKINKLPWFAFGGEYKYKELVDKVELIKQIEGEGQ